MEQVKNVLDGSAVWRALMAICLWFGRQWQNSGIIQWFLHPAGLGRSASESSIFFRLWTLIRGALCRLYQALRLDKLFAGSIFLQSFVWCALPVVLAPVIPTMAVLGLAAVGYGSLALNLLRDPGRPLAWSPIHRYVILYAAVYLAGTVFSVNLAGSLKPGLLSVGFILFTLVLGNAVTGRRQLDALIFLMVLVATAVAFYGILQYLFRWGYQSAAWVDSDMFSSIQFRVPSTLENPNMLGQYLILAIPLGGAKLLSAKSWGSRVFYLCCCGVMFVCMILTFSRGAWLGLLFAGAVFVILLNPRLILLAPFALVALYFVLPDTVISRFTSIGNLTDNSTSYRVYIWMGTLAMLKDYWLCGIGPGDAAFNMVYPAYSYNAIVAPHAHNLFLQTVCDAGISALVVFLLLLFVYFRMTCSTLNRERDWTSRLLQIAFTAGVLGFLVQAMTDYSFYNYRVMFLFWAYLALGSLSARRSELPEGGLLV
ncbi:MAG: O-antigen ligase family protein [Lawsonibacter sp.]|nr:O-antigen ligase family protein [Lawsonibacter sp.]